MHFKQDAKAVLESRQQSIRPACHVARGYTPPAPLPLVALAFHLRRAIRGRLRGATAARYADSHLFLAFVGGLVIAACVFVPFLPRLP